MEQDFAYRAKVLITQRRYQEAVRLCRGGLLANPDHVEGKIVLAMALMALRQFDQVRHEMTSLVQQRPDSAEARRLLGEAYLRLGDRERARAHLDAALASQPDDPATLNLLAEVDEGRRATPQARRWVDAQDLVTLPTGPPLFPDEEEEPTATSPRPSPTVLPGLIPGDRQGRPGSSDLLETPTVREGPRRATPPPLPPDVEAGGDEEEGATETEIATKKADEAGARGAPLFPEPGGPECQTGTAVDIAEPTEVEERGPPGPHEGERAEEAPPRAGDGDLEAPGGEPAVGDDAVPPGPPSADKRVVELMPGVDDEVEDETVVDPEAVHVMAPVLRALDEAERAAAAAKGGGPNGVREEMIAEAEASLEAAAAARRAMAAAAREAMVAEAEASLPEGEQRTLAEGDEGPTLVGGEDGAEAAADRSSETDVEAGERADAESIEEAATRAADAFASVVAEVGSEAIGSSADAASSDASEVGSGDILGSSEVEATTRHASVDAEVGAAEVSDLEEDLSRSVEEAIDEALSHDEEVETAAAPAAGSSGLDPEATRMLDAASAAVVRAQAGAPSSTERHERSRDRPSSKSLALRRDHEGTDSFSDAAEATMVDEDSVSVMREQMRSIGGLAGGPTGEEGSAAEAAAGAPSTARAEEEPGPPPEPAERPSPAPRPPGPPVAAQEIGAPPPPPPEGADRPKPKTTLPLGFGIADDARLPAVSPPPPPPPPAVSSAPPGGRDPAMATAVVRDEGGGEAGGDDKEELTVSEIPGGSRKALEALQGFLGHDDAASGAEGASGPEGLSPAPPPPPLPVGGPRRPTPAGFEVPPPPSRPSSSVDERPGMGAFDGEDPVAGAGPSAEPPRAVLPEPEASPDPLDQPLDPDEFPRARLPLPEPEKSIPLRTGDLMMEAESGEAESIQSGDLLSVKDVSDSPLVPAPPLRTSPPPPPAAPAALDPLDQPFKPEDFSSHRIPLPEHAGQLPDADVLDRPLSPEEFDSSSVKVGYRPLPPISPLDQPISPDDFTPGPRPRPKLSDPLSEPFWPEDFEDGGEADLRSKAFRFGRTIPPQPISPPESAPPPRPPAPPPPPPAPARFEPMPRMSPPPAAMGGQPSPPPPVMSPPPMAVDAHVVGPSPSVSPPHPGLGLGGPGASPGPSGPPPTIFPGELDPVHSDIAERARRHAAGAAPPDRAAVAGRSDRAAKPRRKQAEPAKRPPKRKKGPWKLVAAGVGAAAVIAATVFGVMTFLSVREVNLQREEAARALGTGNYQDYVRAAGIYEALLAAHPGDERLLVEAARIRAMMALEFGTDDDQEADRLIKRAREEGATEQDLASALAAVHLFKGHLQEVDKVLTSVDRASGKSVTEYHYLRGKLLLRQDATSDAMRMFHAAAEEEPGDVRLHLGYAAALHAKGSYQDALQKLADAKAISPQNVELQLLLAKVDIDSGSDPRKGAETAERVIDELAARAAPGQLGWASLLRARYLVTESRAGALAQVDKARKSRPNRDAEFAGMLAETFLKLDHPESAREEATKALDLAAGEKARNRYRLLLAEAMIEEGDLDAAERQLRPVPRSFRASLLMGRIFFARGELRQAEQHFEAAEEGDIEAPQAKLFRARIFLRTGKATEAISLLEDLAEGPPAIPEAWSLLGEAYLTTGKLPEADKALKRATEAMPDDPGVAVSYGKLYERRGDYDQAVDAVDVALKRAPDLPEALAARGSLHLLAGENHQAAELYDRALAARPTDGEILVGRARVHTALREFDSAEELLSKAGKRASPGLLLLARGELKLARYELGEAEDLLEKAAEALPGDPRPLALLGDALVRQGPGSARRADRAYAKALAARKGYPPALVGRAEVALVRGLRSFTEYISEAESALETASRPPDSKLVARLHALKGRYAYEVNGEPEEARDLLRKALESDPDNAEAHISLALVSEEFNDRRGACEHYKAFLAVAEKGPGGDVREARSGVRANCGP